VLDNISKMLLSLGIGSNIYKKRDRKFDGYVLVVSRHNNVLHFRDRVGFRINRKQQRLESMLSYKITGRHRRWSNA